MTASQPNVSDPLEQAAELYARYVEVAEIGSLAEIAAMPDELDELWHGAPPVGLLITG